MMHRNSGIAGKRHAAAATIQRAWIGYKNRQVFRLLKCTVAAAEHSLTREILRKLAPKEADFFSRDESLLQLKIRFRFGGTEFPPRILYKIFVDAASGQCKVTYVNGKGTIRAETEAAAQSAKLMGNRKYYDLMLQDGLMRLQHRVADEADVVTVKDFMRLLAVTDETQAELGGKANTWRQLTSLAAPRHTVFRDVIDYLATRRLTERLRNHLPLLTAMPSSQEVRREQLRVLAEVEAPRLTADDKQRLAQRLREQRQRETGGVGGASETGTSRRSSRAMSRAQKMRQLYLAGGDKADGGGGGGGGGGVGGGGGGVVSGPVETAPNGDQWLRSGVDRQRIDDFDEEEEEEIVGEPFPAEYYSDGEEEDFEEEADMLYEWTRELTEGQLGSPRPA